MKQILRLQEGGWCPEGDGVFNGKTTVKNTGSNYTERWNSNRFGLYFQPILCKS